PVVPSKTSSVSCGASGISRVIIRFTFSNSFIKLTLFCNLPAVSQINTSAFLDLAARIASYTTAAGSLPSDCLITSTPACSPHSSNCSIAPALNVSPAAKTTCLSSFFNRSEEHTSELQSRFDLVCRLLLEHQKRYTS